MFAEIEKIFKVKLLSRLFTNSTIEELARVFAEKARQQGVATRRYPAEGSRPPLFCFHGAGGNVLIYAISRAAWFGEHLLRITGAGLDGTIHTNP